jgi:outer membrane lipoprotein-sorting protein
MKSLSLFATVLILHFMAAGTPSMLAADQSGAEKSKSVASVEVVGTASAENAEKIGNVEVTYADGTKDRWTTKGDAGLALVASDGTVGWTVYAPETKIAASYKVRPNNTLVICRQGKVLCRAKTALPFIEEWRFVDDGKQFAVKTRAAHGPATLELHETKTGKLLATAKAADDQLPKWAEPYRE